MEELATFICRDNIVTRQMSPVLRNVPEDKISAYLENTTMLKNHITTIIEILFQPIVWYEALRGKLVAFYISDVLDKYTDGSHIVMRFSPHQIEKIIDDTHMYVHNLFVTSKFGMYCVDTDNGIEILHKCENNIKFPILVIHMCIVGKLFGNVLTPQKIVEYIQFLDELIGLNNIISVGNEIVSETQ
jgi:hypothetical protein